MNGFSRFAQPSPIGVSHQFGVSHPNWENFPFSYKSLDNQKIIGEKKNTKKHIISEKKNTRPMLG